MTVISNLICEAVTECVNQAASADKPFWDLKACLTAIGILIALCWNVIQYFSGKKRRKKDQQWEMFRDEIYSPFLEALNNFEQKIRPAQLAVKLSGLGHNELSKTIGEFFAEISEMEVLCKRADDHEYTSNSVFSTKFTKYTGELDGCIDYLLNSEDHETQQFEAVSDAYRKLIEELRACLSSCRKDLH